MYHFHESYFDHACSILPDKDVLDLEIPGNGIMPRFRRWWYNLFLLNYDDDRSRIYYNSSHAMAIERIRHFRWYKTRIHPISKFRNCWDLMIFLILVIHTPIFTITSTFLRIQLPLYCFYFGIFLDWIIVIDLYVSFKTGFIDNDKRTVILDSFESNVHYCSTKLFLHAATAIPCNTLIFFRYGSNIYCKFCKTNYLIATLKFVYIFHLMRIFETSAYLTRNRQPAQCCKFLRIIIVALVSVGHFVNFFVGLNLWYILYNHHVDGSSTMAALILGTKADSDTLVEEILGIFVMNTLFPSFFITSIPFFLDTAYFIVVLITSITLTGWIFIECYSYVVALYYADNERYGTRKNMLNLVDYLQLPDNIKAKVNLNFDLELTEYKSIAKKHGLYSSLPQVLKNEVMLSCYYKCLMRLPYFKEWPLQLVEELVLMTNKQVYLPNDIIAEAWTEGDGLVVVDTGVLAVYTEQMVECGHLIDGDYFDEVSLVTDREVRMSYVVAVTSASVLILPKEMFRKHMQQHPKLFFEMKEKIHRKYMQKFSSFNTFASQARSGDRA